MKMVCASEKSLTSALPALIFTLNSVGHTVKQFICEAHVHDARLMYARMMDFTGLDFSVGAVCSSSIAVS